MEKSHFINMGVTELLRELLINDNVKFGYLDIYTHIRNNTNNFEIQAIPLLYDDLYLFIGEEICLIDKTGKWSLNELYDMHFLREIQNGINFEGWKGMTTKENELSQYIDLVDILLKNNGGLELENEYGFYKVSKYVDMFNSILEKQNIDIEKLLGGDEWNWKIDRNNKQTNPPKKPLTFSGLFKDEYKGKIEQFYNKLFDNGLIDTNQVWRETTDKNEPAKVYFWLLNNGVFKINKHTPALICFCKEFRITAYKDSEPTPPAEMRAVTIKNLLNAENTISPDEKKRFENIFLSYLIK